MLPKIWQSDEYEYEGKFWNVPSPPGTAKTFQKPHPRMYLACTSEDSFRLAAEKGIGVLSSASYAVNVLKDKLKIYRESIGNTEPAGAFITNFWGNNVHGFCDDDDQYAKELAAESMKTFFGPDKPYIQGRIGAYEQLLGRLGRCARSLAGGLRALAPTVGRGTSAAGCRGGHLARLRSGSREGPLSLNWTPMFLPTAESSLRATPESCLRAIKMYEEIGVDQVLIIMQTETIPHDKVMSSIEKFGKYVIPEARNGAKDKLEAVMAAD